MIYINTIDLIAIPNEDIRFVRAEKRRIGEDIDDQYGDIIVGSKDFTYRFENVQFASEWTRTIVSQILAGVKNNSRDIFINPIGEKSCLFDRKLVIKQNHFR